MIIQQQSIHYYLLNVTVFRALVCARVVPGVRHENDSKFPNSSQRRESLPMSAVVLTSRYRPEANRSESVTQSRSQHKVNRSRMDIPLEDLVQRWLNLDQK